MDNSFNETKYETLIDDYADFEKSFSNLYNSLMSNNSTVMNDLKVQYGLGNHRVALGRSLSKVFDTIVPFKGNVTKLERSIETYLEKKKELKASGKDSFGEAVSVPYLFKFGYSSSSRSDALTTLYGNYSVSNWVDGGKSFSDYNDINAFMNSDQYWANNTFVTGTSEYSNYKLIAVGSLSVLLDDPSLLDYYTNEFLIDSIMAVMNETCGSETAGGISGSMKAFTGHKAWDKIAGLIKDKLKAYFESEKVQELLKNKAYTKDMSEADIWDKALNEALKDPEIAALIDVLAEESGLTESEVTKFLQNSCKLVGSTGEILDKVLTGIEFLDPLLKYAENSFADYSAQISYLNTIQESMISNGFPYGPVHEAINEVRKRYSSAFYTMLVDSKKSIDKAVEKWGAKAVQEAIIKGAEGDLRKTGATLAKETASEVLKTTSTKEGIRTGAKMAEETAGATVGEVLGSIDKGLKTVSTVSKILGAKRISADKSLMGLKQWDSCLTRDFENYQDMIKKGIASKRDIEEAQKIYETLLTVKKQEYQAMMTMCAKGNEKYNYFKKKYDELDAWSKDQPLSAAFSESDLLKDDTISNLNFSGGGQSSGHGASRSY